VVSLTKIIDGQSSGDALPNHSTVKCPRCEQQYRLASTDDEWNKLHTWLKLAAAAIRATHPRHEAETLPLVWKFRLNRR
jgi:hypothetical protein